MVKFPHNDEILKSGGRQGKGPAGGVSLNCERAEASRAFSFKAAMAVKGFLERLDLRLLMALVSVLGVSAWVLPWPTALWVLPAALPPAWAAWRSRAVPRGAMAAYLLFVGIWTAAQFLLALTEEPGSVGPAAWAAASLGGRLVVVVGLALAMPLAATPISIARAVCWFLSPFDRLLGSSAQKVGEEPGNRRGAWRVALALCLMMSFFPRALIAAKNLNRTLALRAPGMTAFRKARILGEALLRVMGAQAWDVALAVAARDLWRPGPWIWRKRRR